MTELIQCEREHLLEIGPMHQPGIAEDWIRKNMESISLDIAFTMMVDDAPLACFGVSPDQELVCTAWAMPSKAAADRYALSLCKYVRRKLDWVQDEMHFVRVQSTVDVTFDAGIRWLEWLGFEREGTMRCWGPMGADHHLYARIR